MVKKGTISVRDISVSIIEYQEQDFVSITDMIKAREGDLFISDWVRNRNTVEYLGIWESINNPLFNYGEFAIIKRTSPSHCLASLPLTGDQPIPGRQAMYGIMSLLSNWLSCQILRVLTR
jgi:hypothetical protein